MKRILVALALGLLLVSLIATPVFAKPTKGALVAAPAAEQVDLDTRAAVASIAPTHTNFPKVTVALRGAVPDTQYTVHVYDLSGAQAVGDFYLMTNSKGNARGSAILTEVYTEDETVTFRVSVSRAGSIRLWWDPGMDVTF